MSHWFGKKLLASHRWRGCCCGCWCCYSYLYINRNGVMRSTSFIQQSISFINMLPNICALEYEIVEYVLRCGWWTELMFRYFYIQKIILNLFSCFTDVIDCGRPWISFDLNDLNILNCKSQAVILDANKTRMKQTNKQSDDLKIQKTPVAYYYV